MITLKLQIILLSGSVICSIMVVNLIRRYKLELKYSMLWLFIMFTVLVLSIFPNSIGFISMTMGIELPVNALFLIALFGLFLIVFSLTLTVSRSSIKIKELSQEIGLLKYQFEEMQKREK